VLERFEWSCVRGALTHWHHLLACLKNVRRGGKLGSVSICTFVLVNQVKRVELCRGCAHTNITALHASRMCAAVLSFLALLAQQYNC
jgi:hypothetical protein